MTDAHGYGEHEARRLARSGAADHIGRLNETHRARFAAVGEDGDVRVIDSTHRYDPVVQALLAPGASFALWAFHTSPDGSPWVDSPTGFTSRPVGNQPLGPLADLQVYATDPHGQCAGQWRGKSHGICQHQHELSVDSHDLLTLDQFLPLHQQDPGYLPYSGSGWCSQCAGFAVRRLTEDQFSYYAQVLHQAEVRLHGQH